MAPDGRTACVAMKENNTFAVVEIANARVTTCCRSDARTTC